MSPGATRSLLRTGPASGASSSSAPTGCARLVAKATLRETSPRRAARRPATTATGTTAARHRPTRSRAAARRAAERPRTNARHANLAGMQVRPRRAQAVARCHRGPRIGGRARRTRAARPPLRSAGPRATRSSRLPATTRAAARPEAIAVTLTRATWAVASSHRLRALRTRAAGSDRCGWGARAHTAAAAVEVARAARRVRAAAAGR
ncbi:hypothetical protein T492DRAFT_1082715 [Pavlovales sp. CCMP2436]|nr:hypothetical protein T492DRAFT_1082715 [Pavlovales sp. CCMP2436]